MCCLNTLLNLNMSVLLCNYPRFYYEYILLIVFHVKHGAFKLVNRLVFDECEFITFYTR